MATTKGEKGHTDQAAKFRELARQVECDQDEWRFDAALKRVAKAPQPPKDQKSAPQKPGN